LRRFLFLLNSATASSTMTQKTVAANAIPAATQNAGSLGLGVEVSSLDKRYLHRYE